MTVTEYMFAYVLGVITGYPLILLIEVLWQAIRSPALTELPATWRALNVNEEEIVVGGRTYRGGCTVWEEYPSGRRCSTATEVELSEIAQREKWARKERDKKP